MKTSNPTKSAVERLPASAGSAEIDPVMTLTDPVHGGPIRAVHELDYDAIQKMEESLRIENCRLRVKLRETKKYLRAANKGAERNALVSQLLAARNVKLFEEMQKLRQNAEVSGERSESAGLTG